jgi:hypothetical protein
MVINSNIREIGSDSIIFFIDEAGEGVCAELNSA